MERQINCSAIWYYNLSKEQAITVRYTIELKDPVEGDLLRQATDITAKRFPYLLDKIVATPEGYHLEPCEDLPIVVRHTHHAITLCGPEANYHQFALSYSGHSIYFDNTHSMFDGRGRGPVLHTLLYYYFKLRYPDDEIDMPGVCLADSPIDPAEYFDPFAQPLPAPKTPLPEIVMPTHVMDLETMGLVHKSHMQLHHLSIDEQQLMQCCKNNDATPNTAISLLLARAIDRLHPDAGKTISAGVYCDMRAALKAELTHRPLVTTLELEYAPEMREMSFAEQNTIFRGKMLLQAEPSNLLRSSLMTKRACDFINAQPTLQEKIQVAQNIARTVLKSHTFSVSYSGKSAYGSCSKYISALFPQVQAKGIGIMIEITSADGKFFLTFIQEWKEDVYFNAFLKELTRQGIDYDLLYSAQNEPSLVDIAEN